MLYRNKRTKAIIDIDAELKGDEWEAVKEEKSPRKPKGEKAEEKSEE